MTRKLIVHNLKQNSLSAYYSAIEIHNKPNFKYRYETVVILLINAWELILKAFLKSKDKKGIFYKKGVNKGKTLSIDDCITRIRNIINEKKLDKKYIVYLENIKLLTEYRNNCIHFYNDEKLNPILFSLISKSCIDFNNFYYDFYNKSPMELQNLYIAPIGFKLPFNPKDFLSKHYIESMVSDNSKIFIEKVVRTIEDIEKETIDETIVIGFDIYLNSVKKLKNSDLMISIDPASNKTLNISKQYKIVDDENATRINISDEEWFKIYKYDTRELIDKIKKDAINFKQNVVFNSCMKILKKDKKYSDERKLSKNLKGQGRWYYTDEGYNKLKLLLIDNFKQ